MTDKPQVSASILASDFANLEKEIKAVEKAGADMIHLDVMDGHFVDNITFGPDVIRSIRKCTKKPLDTHLMIKQVDKYINDFIDAGCDTISFHIEACKKPMHLIQKLKEHGIKAGLAINPDTKIKKIKKFLPHLDFVLVMSVYPGFSGQEYINQIDKIKELKAMLEGSHIKIEVDGGVCAKNSANLIEAGVDILVAGNYIFKAKNYKTSIHNLKG